MKKGLLIINLGTPKRADKKSVRLYLREFLMDKRVIQLNVVLRYLLLFGVILPFRTSKSLHAYQSIWTKNGSPLLYHTQQLLQKLQHHLQDDYHVALGMRYGAPSIENALHQLRNLKDITVLPLYPQYSSAATGSSIEKTLRLLAPQSNLPTLTIIRDFYQHPAYIKAQSKRIAPYIPQHDFILFSYHGLPESHLIPAGCTHPCLNECSMHAPDCYRSQCFKTSALLAKSLGLTENQYATSFQSRLGKTPWIKPYTDDILGQLAAQGIQRLAVSCPSFVADCLETLEEIGIRAQEQWHRLGGSKLTLIPALNDDDGWIEAIVHILQ